MNKSLSDHQEGIMGKYACVNGKYKEVWRRFIAQGNHFPEIFFFRAVFYELIWKGIICSLRDQILPLKKSITERDRNIFTQSNLPCNLEQRTLFYRNLPQNIGKKLLKQATIVVILVRRGLRQFSWASGLNTIFLCQPGKFRAAGRLDFFRGLWYKEEIARIRLLAIHSHTRSTVQAVEDNV